MIQYTNIHRYDNLDFEEYLRLPSYSHSFLKAEKNGSMPEFKVTDKVILGKMVDAILSDVGPIEMLHPLYPIARAVALKIKSSFGNFIDRFEKQVSYTADLIHNGYVMPSKVRLDFLLPGHASIELKVTHERDIRALIVHMGYKNQTWHQCRMAGVDKQFILIYSMLLKKAELINVGTLEPSNEFWENKILKFGRPHGQVQEA